MPRRRMAVPILVAVACATLVAGCLPGDGTHTAANPAGFLWAVWHGWAAPFSVLFGFFRPAIRVYEVNNTGWWYDFGFYIAVISGFGGLSLTRRRRSPATP